MSTAAAKAGQRARRHVVPSLRLPRLDRWSAGALLLSALFAVPVVTVLVLALQSRGEVWDHLASTVLPRYLANTAALMLGVGATTLVIGVVTAWLVTMTRFPGRRIFEWALLLPLAMPAYVVAYTYAGLTDYAGPVQSGLRALFGWESRADYWFPAVRSVGGAVTIMSLTLYPYVYLLARTAFLQQSVCALEVGRTLGVGPWGSFFRIALPLARPALAVGLALVLMETLSDFGTVQHFGIDVFTTGIYRVWLGMGDAASAAQLAAILLLFVALLATGEQWSRRRQRYHATTGRYREISGHRLSGVRAGLAIAACALPILLGFLVPGGTLFAWGLETAGGVSSAGLLRDAWHSFVLATTTSALAVGLGLFLAYGARRANALPVRLSARIASVGYAVPGPVIALGVLVPFAAFDRLVDHGARSLFGVSTGLLLSGTIAAVVFACLVRFFALSFGTVDSSLGRVTPSMEGAARSLGHGTGSVLRRIYAPLVSGGLLTAGLLVFVDVLKELPATLMLRPFNFDTLAVRAYQFASDEQLRYSALPALAIVAVGIVPVILLSLAIARSRPGSTRR